MTAAHSSKAPAAAAAAAAAPAAAAAAGAAGAAGGATVRNRDTSGDSSIQGLSAAATHRFVFVRLISSSSSSSSNQDGGVDRSILHDPHRQCDLEATDQNFQQLLDRRLEGWKRRCLPSLPLILQRPRLSAGGSSSACCCCCCCVRLVDLNLLQTCLSPQPEADLSTFFVELMYCVSWGFLHPQGAVSFLQQQLLPRALLHLLLLLRDVLEAQLAAAGLAAAVSPAGAAAAARSAAAAAAGGAAVKAEHDSQNHAAAAAATAVVAATAAAAPAAPATAAGEGEAAVKRLAEEAAPVCAAAAAAAAGAAAAAAGLEASAPAATEAGGHSKTAEEKETASRCPCVSFAACFNGAPSLASLDRVRARAFIDHIVVEASGQGAQSSGAPEGGPHQQQGAPEKRRSGLLPQPFLALLLDGLTVCGDLNAGTGSALARKARATVAGCSSSSCFLAAAGAAGPRYLSRHLWVRLRLAPR
ncbi:hypothetical protein Efla_005028 [Eimeria flavescens]